MSGSQTLNFAEQWTPNAYHIKTAFITLQSILLQGIAILCKYTTLNRHMQLPPNILQKGTSVTRVTFIFLFHLNCSRE